MFLEKSNLKYKDYKWTAYSKEDPRITGKPKTTPFNKQEGNEVLSLINEFAFAFELSESKDTEKIEKMIHDNLPEDALTRKSALDWIEFNWNKY